MTFASVINSCSERGGEKAKRKAKLSLEAVGEVESKQEGVFAEITVTRRAREESSEPET